MLLLFCFSYYFDWAQGPFPFLQARSSANLVPTPAEIKGPRQPNSHLFQNQAAAHPSPLSSVHARPTGLFFFRANRSSKPSARSPSEGPPCTKPMPRLITREAFLPRARPQDPVSACTCPPFLFTPSAHTKGACSLCWSKLPACHPSPSSCHCSSHLLATDLSQTSRQAPMRGMSPAAAFPLFMQTVTYELRQHLFLLCMTSS